MLAGEPFEEILAQPSLGAGQPAAVSQRVVPLLDEFHLLIHGVTVMRVCAGRTLQIQKGLVQVLLQGQGGFHGVRSFTPLLLGKHQHILQENKATVLVVHL